MKLTKALWKLNSFNKDTNKSGLLDFATIISCDIQESTRIPQIATDGQSIFVNPEWWEKQSTDNQVFALSHEAKHIQFLHCERGIGIEDIQRWRIACDISVNDQCLRDGHKPTKDLDIVLGSYYDITQPSRYSVEQIYAKLPATPPEDQQASPFGSLSDAGDILPSKMGKELAAAKLQSIKVAASEMGFDLSYLPKELTDAYTAVTSPIKNFKEECWRFVARLRESHWSMTRLMPAYRARRQIMPSIKRSHKLEFGIVIDTSGSINSDIYGQFIDTVSQAFSQLKPERMIAILADDLIRDEMELRELPANIPFKGRGGTDFRPALKRFEKAYPDIGGVIYVTDGYGDFPHEAPSFPLLWAINNNDVRPPYGDVCRI